LKREMVISMEPGAKSPPTRGRGLKPHSIRYGPCTLGRPPRGGVD